MFIEKNIAYDVFMHLASYKRYARPWIYKTIDKFEFSHYNSFISASLPYIMTSIFIKISKMA